MLLASNYFLLGSFFCRRISIDESGARSVDLHRINSFLHNWYVKQIHKSYESFDISISSQIVPDVITENLKRLSDYYGTEVDYYDFNFKYVNKYTNLKKTSLKISLEKDYINNKHSKAPLKSRIKSEVILDSFSSFPIIPTDKESEKVNYEIFRQIYPKIKSNADIIILTGELVWSGWLSLDIILNTLNDKKLENKIIIIDSWGLLQQLISTSNFENKYNIENYDDLCDSFTASIYLTSKKVKPLVEISKIKSTNSSLYANSEIIKNYPSGVAHKPDYVYVLSKKSNTLLNKNVISLGIDKVTPFTIPKSFLEKVELTYSVPAGSVLQKYEGEKVTMKEDIGLVPIYETHKLKLKLPKQLTLTVEEGQMIKKGDILAYRSVLKNMLKEKITSPFTGFLNTDYLNQGILLFKSPIEKKQYLSDFEGDILSFDKSKNGQKMKILANSFTSEIIYKIGNDTQGQLLRMGDVTSTNEDKLLLIKPSELADINLELIVDHNVKGVIIDSPDYSLIRSFIGKVLKSSKLLTICVLSPFSLRGKNNIVDILYLHTGNSVLISNNSIHLLIDQQQNKQILMRLKSKDTQSKNNLLKKGEIVSFFNYSHQDPYVRIENVSPDELVLNTEGEMITSNYANIIKYSNTFYDTENK